MLHRATATGTTLRLPTSKLHTPSADLGFAQFEVYFLADLNLGLSTYIANYFGVDMGVECTLDNPDATSADGLTCVTTALDDTAVWTAPATVADARLSSWDINRCCF